MDIKQVSDNTCLYYKWAINRLVLMIYWIDDNLIMESDEAVSEAKKMLMMHFECKDYVNWKNKLDARTPKRGDIIFDSLNQFSFRVCLMGLNCPTVYT